MGTQKIRAVVRSKAEATSQDLRPTVAFFIVATSFTPSNLEGQFPREPI